jgi:photosystem II stability/assembly factor-like uncharacterized protein
MFTRKSALLAITAVASLALAQAALAQTSFAQTSFAQTSAVKQPTLTPQQSGTTNLLISVSPVNSQIVWAAGVNGTYAVTTDGGTLWRSGVVPGAEQLQFRDVQGVSAQVAYLLSIGNDATNFQIYKTVTGGATWTIEFTNELPEAFYDCFAFWTPTNGVAHDDSENGVFPDLLTSNGKTWQSLANRMPPPLPGEASFSSSGTCITTQGSSNAWITTGGSSIARILYTYDGGFSWNAADTPLTSSPSAGGFSVAFRNPLNGVVGGGDLSSSNNAQMAASVDGGETWTLTNTPPVQGAIFALAYAGGMHFANVQNGKDESNRTVVVTGEAPPNFDSGQAAWTPDEGQTWYPLPNVSGYWGLAFANPQAGWFVGNNGQILKISF